MNNLNFESSKDKLDAILAQSKVFDLGVPIHRTNSLPLDISAVIYLDLDNNYESRQKFNEAAKEALKAQNNATWYPGQQIAVLGKVEDTCHATCFILQSDGQEAKELAYTEDVLQQINEQITEQIQSLATVMRFRGVLENLPSLDTHDYLPGDVVVIKRAAGVTGNGTPGMEYVCVENSQGSANRYSWVELGFGTNLIQFIGGGTGLTLPSTPLVKESKSLIDFIKQADKFLGYKIGILNPSGELDMPEVTPGDKEQSGYSLVTYINNANKKIADAVVAEETRASAAEKKLDDRVVTLEQNSATKTELNTKVSNTDFNQFKKENSAAIAAAKNEAIADARFQEDLTLTYQFGKYAPDDTGSFTLHCAGKTMKEVLLDAFAQEIYEGLILTVPTVSFSLSGTNTTNTGEVGTTHGSPAAKLDLNISGSYKYGAKTSTGTLANPAIKATSARILMNDVTKISMDEANPNADLTYTHNLTGNDLIYKDGTDTYTFVAYASHGADDNRPLTNLGNFVSGSPGNYTGTTEFSKAVGHITAKAETEFCNGKTVSASYTGYRKMFMGTVATDPTAVNSDFIRGLNKVSEKAVKGAKEFTVAAGQKSFYVAVPTSLTTAVPTFKYKFFGNWEVQNGVVALDGTVSVEGANGYEAKPYKVYRYTPASGSFEANTDIQVTIN